MSTAKSKRLVQWIIMCLRIGSLSFGGAGRIVLYRDAVVHDKKWLTNEEFQEIITIASICPGSNLINLVTYIGYKLFGNIGAISGVLMLCMPGAILALLVLWFVPIENPDIARLFQGLTIGSLGIIFLFIIQLLNGLKSTHHQGQASSAKIYLRIFLAIIIMGMGFLEFPFLLILFSGAFLGLLLEFFV